MGETTLNRRGLLATGAAAGAWCASTGPGCSRRSRRCSSPGNARSWP